MKWSGQNKNKKLKQEPITLWAAVWVQLKKNLKHLFFSIILLKANMDCHVRLYSTAV